MELLKKWKLPVPFMVNGKQCIAVIQTTSTIRIFYDCCVYDVVIGTDQMQKLLCGGIEQRRDFIRDALLNGLIEAKPTNHHVDAREMFVV